MDCANIFSKKLFRKKGEEILRDALEALGYVVKKDFNNETIKLLLDHFKLDSLDDVLIKIGKEEISLTDIPEFVKHKSRKLTIKSLTPSFLMGKSKKKETIDNKNYSIAPCCKPIPGDDIIGFKTEDGVIIHKIPIIVNNHLLYRTVTAINNPPSTTFKNIIL